MGFSPSLSLSLSLPLSPAQMHTCTHAFALSLSLSKRKKRKRTNCNRLYFPPRVRTTRPSHMLFQNLLLLYQVAECASPRLVPLPPGQVSVNALSNRALWKRCPVTSEVGPQRRCSFRLVSSFGSCPGKPGTRRGPHGAERRPPSLALAGFTAADANLAKERE